MNDNAPHKKRPLYSVWPIVVLMLFMGAAISLWEVNHFLAIIVCVVGIIIYWVWIKARTKMILEELTLRELFRGWFHTP